MNLETTHLAAKQRPGPEEQLKELGQSPRIRRRRKEPETMADNELRISEVPTGLVVAGGGLDKRVMTKASNFVTSHAAGEWGMEAYTGRRAPTHDEIAQLAFNLYESRGRQDGHDVEDWLRAEEGLVRRYA